MESSEDILLNSLSNGGVSIPASVSSVQDLTPSTLFSLCSNALRLINVSGHTTSFPSSLPEDSMTERVKACTDIAAAFKALGFTADLSFQKFLYPSKQDLYELVRFLVGRLSEISESRVAAVRNGVPIGRVLTEEEVEPGDVEGSLQNEETLARLNDLKLKGQAPESSSPMKSRDNSDQSNPASADDAVGVGEPRAMDFSQTEFISGVESSRIFSRDDNGSQCKVLQDGEEIIKKQIDVKYLELQKREQELALLKEAIEMAFDEQLPVEFHIEQLNNQVDAKQQRLKELESEWNETEESLEEKRRNLEQSLFSMNPEACENLRRRKQMELEAQFVLAEIKRREEENCKLSSDLQKQPKLAPRRSYIERINETTKNSRKLDTDIQRILKDTRELQLESNTIQERLNRTYAVVDETIFREAKKDPIARQAYRLLTKFHQSFEQIAEDIVATDRCRRDSADYEAKLASIRARSLNMDKVQEDIEAIRKENDLLEQKLRNA